MRPAARLVAGAAALAAALGASTPDPLSAQPRPRAPGPNGSTPTAGPPRAAIPESPGPTPRIVAGPGGTWQVALPASMGAALAAALPRFRPWRAADYDPEMMAHGSGPTADGVPWGVITDLDGDGQPDAALLGTDGRHILLVAVVTGDRTGGRSTAASQPGPGHPGSPRVIVLAQDDPEPGVPELHVLRAVPAGRQDACEGPPVVLPHPGVAREVPDKGGSTIYYLGPNGRPAAESTGC